VQQASDVLQLPASSLGVTAVARPAIPNFRDVGGHLSSDGSRVRRGLLYRSVDPGRVDRAGTGFLAALGLRTVFDLRTAMERQRDAGSPPAGARLVELDVLADGGAADPAQLFELMQDPPRASAELARGGAERFFLSTYRDMVRLPSARTGFGKLLRSLARAEVRPALVHCTTGKDRTGWAVAVLLLALGVAADAVMDEYMLSDSEVRRAFKPFVDDFVARGGEREVIEPLVGVQPAFLQAAVDEMSATFGSLENYLSEGLGLEGRTLASLRRAFLGSPS